MMDNVLKWGLGVLILVILCTIALKLVGRGDVADAAASAVVRKLSGGTPPSKGVALNNSPKRRLAGTFIPSLDKRFPLCAKVLLELTK